MKNNPIFFGKITDGKLELHQPELFRMYLGTLDGDVRVEVSKHRRNRTLDQNSYYWVGIVTPISDWTGYTVEEAHDSLKALFLTQPDQRLPKVPSTTLLNTTEFSDYIEKIMRWAATQGVYLQTAEEYRGK